MISESSSWVAPIIVGVAVAVLAVVSRRGSAPEDIYRYSTGYKVLLILFLALSIYCGIGVDAIQSVVVWVIGLFLCYLILCAFSTEYSFRDNRLVCTSIFGRKIVHLNNVVDVRIREGRLDYLVCTQSGIQMRISFFVQGADALVQRCQRGMTGSV